MKRSLISLILATLLGLGNIPTAQAYASLSGCLSGRGSGSVSGTTLTLTINLTITCTATDPKDPTKPATFYSLFYMDFPVYEIQEELFSSNACNGPLLGLTRMISGTNAGIVTCRLSNSSRYGATSSTLKIYAGDSVFVPISHPAIPEPASSGGGSSGSSSSGTTSSGNTGTTVVPTCTAAPGTPNLSIEWNSTGPKFIYSPASSGQKATALFWKYSLWNSSTKSWEGWSSAVMAPVAPGVYQASVLDGKSRIAFAVQAANACGASTQAREREDLTGVPLIPLQQDEITRNTKSSPDLKEGLDLDLYLIATSKLDLELEATSSTPNICTINQTQVLLNSVGTCKLLVSSKTFEYEFGAKPTEVQFEVTKLVAQIIPNLNIKTSYYLSTKSLELLLRTDAALTVRFKSLTTKACDVLGSTLSLITTGSCILQATQEGDSNTLPAPVRKFEIWIDSGPVKTIYCFKGKLTKRVTATRPKCPAGYKVNK